MPPAREKTPPRGGRVSQPPPAPRGAATRDQTPKKPFKDLDESIQRASRPPDTPATVRDRAPAEELEPMSGEPMSGEPMSIEPMPMSSEMTADILSAPDTVPAPRAQAALEMARAQEAEKAKAKEAEAAKAKAKEAEAAKAKAKEAEAAKAKAKEAEAAKPKPSESREIARPRPSDAAAAQPPEDRAQRPSIPNPPSRTVAPVIDPAMLAPKPTPSDAGTAGPSAAAAKAASSEPVASTKPLTSSAAASTALKEPVTPDADPRVVETVSGIANTSPDMLLPPKTPPKKLARIGVLAAVGGVALLIAVFGIRSFQKGQLERVCESEAAPGDATTARITACGDLCKAGSGIYCNAHGELLLQSPGAGGEVDKKGAAAAFQSACGLGYDPGCKRVAELSNEARNAASAPTATPTAPTATAPDIDIDAESSPAKHIMVMFRQSQGAPATISRTKEEARTRALEVLAKAKGGAKFEDLVQTYTDDAASKDRGGAPDGAMLGKLVSTLERMKKGDLEVIETSGGFHVVLRTEHPLPNANVGSPSGFEPVKKPDQQTTGSGGTTATPPGPTTAPTPTGAPTPTTAPTPTATTAPTPTVTAGPPDEAAMRRALEPKVWNGNASLDEMRLLKAICTHMGDQQCRNRVSAMIAQKQANP
jgi:hypothetical protein